MDGANNRLERIFQDGVTDIGTERRFSFTTQNVLAKTQSIRRLGERILANNVGPTHRQFTFVRTARLFKQRVSHSEVQHRIAKKLQPLVRTQFFSINFGAPLVDVRLVSQRLLQQIAVDECYSEPGFKLV